MNRMIPAGCLAVLLLGGCHATPHKPDYGAASDVARTRHAQYQLWEHGALSGQTHAVTSLPALTANSGRLSFDWDGDAIELLNGLARARGLQFGYNGVRLPLPLTLHVRDMTFENTLRLIQAQTAWRATLTQYPGVLWLDFMPVRKNHKE
ncbi:DotD/TraH family lipoprotein [Escherichia coli]|jgi:defect-in-organelle-trafficking protein DotD|uniref:DotD/TraH family lipoprotein n=1 Tax=Escherichia coli TaxID=562 RepID=UPI000BE3C3C0|nr:DotD/TraH family lipoprotein [Escherichia coli]EHS3656241.1 DotD/TraH family lipoprotein [Escherichia coli]MBB7572570.1 DotD/TraH family lipoprotein [Escherichia coli]MCH7141406.1 hypothetical protein [Escherichia coli]MDY9626755.1 DotD/TraH family lipoprotein [Escherichia coli]MDY9740542.1 DotD/TraH family lipoprotein [Escherichia coli]